MCGGGIAILASASRVLYFVNDAEVKYVCRTLRDDKDKSACGESLEWVGKH